MTTKILRAKSKGEETLARDMKADGLDFYREFQFHPVRKWRADFYIPIRCIPGFMGLLIEVEGMGGAHQTMEGFRKNAEKHLAATKLGYVVIRCTTAQACSGEALEAIHCMYGRLQVAAISGE